MLLKEVTQGLIHLLYPRLCEGCATPLLQQEQVLCLNCLLQLSKTNFHNDENNETALRFAGRVAVQRATSYAHFINDGLLQHLLHRLKYKGQKEIGLFLGRQFAYDLQQTNWIAGIDLLIPVPLHPKKQAVRGYNQSTLIAEGMSAVLKIPVQNNTLKRLRYTESQTQKSRTERMDNMRNAFAITNVQALQDKHVLLIDDVLTTGATLEACAQPLLACNAKISITTIGLAS